MPGATVTEVTPVGVDVKTRLSTVSAASRVVATAGPVTLAVLKMRVSVIAGTTVAGVRPARSSDQFAATFHEPPAGALK